ncbi:MAG TPA: S53 family peptidase [Lacipirellulaceae bacterium]
MPTASTGSLDQVVTPNLDVINPLATLSTPSGLTPAQAKAAYGFSSVKFGSVTGNGAGETIAIVDAYNDPNIKTDLAKFDATFGLAAPPSLKIVNQSGGTALPQNDRGWAGEIALDVEWAHAIAPAANILLVEASSATTSALDAALDYARNAAGVVAVSNSWGGSEYSTEKSQDVHFTTPAGHIGVTFTVAAGDNGAGAEYPSSSPDVLSVGGSTLLLNSSGTYSSESVWSGGGGGASRYEGLPSYQSSLGVAMRGAPDVSYDANPYTGFAVYDSYGGSGWAQYGGTSAGAPQWAALVAIADQGRALAGKESLANAQDALYSLSRSDFHDIASGSNGYRATTGYDLASGLGSPIANLVIRDLVAYNSSTNFSIAAATTTISRTRFFFTFRGFDEAAGEGTALAADTQSAASASVVASATDTRSFQSALSLISGSVSPTTVNANAVESALSSHGRHSALADNSAETADASSAAIDEFFAALDGASPALLVS